MSYRANNQTSEYFAIHAKDKSGKEYSVLPPDGLNFQLAVCGGAAYLVFERYQVYRIHNHFMAYIQLLRD